MCRRGLRGGVWGGGDTSEDFEALRRRSIFCHGIQYCPVASCTMAAGGVRGRGSRLLCKRELMVWGYCTLERLGACMSISSPRSRCEREGWMDACIHICTSAYVHLIISSGMTKCCIWSACFNFRVECNGRGCGRETRECTSHVTQPCAPVSEARPCFRGWLI